MGFQPQTEHWMERVCMCMWGGGAGRVWDVNSLLKTLFPFKHIEPGYEQKRALY